MKLSIVILICDKDYRHFDTLYKNIKEVINIEHEVIVIDNRETTKDTVINFYDCTVHNSNGNARQYNARRIALQYVTGDYVWYVDGDDLLIAAPKLTGADIITVDYAAGELAQYPIIATLDRKKSIQDIIVYNSVPNVWPDTYTNNAGMLEWVTKMWGTLWFKVIKKSVLERAYNMLPENADISSCEDLLLSTAVLLCAKSICVTPDVCYYYCNDNSLCEKSSYTLEEFSQLLHGQDTYQLLMYGMLKHQAKILTHMNTSNAHWFLKRLARVREEDFKAARNLLYTYFNKTLLIKAIIDVYAVNDIDTAIDMLKALKEQFND